MTTAGNIMSAPETVLLVTKRSGVWTVRINNRFYGDYAKREWAFEAASKKQQEIITAGGRARVVSA